MAARKIKREKPVLSIVDDPPYSDHSYNRGKFIGELINEYKPFDREPLNEKNPKRLNDDYVKFIR